MRARDEPTVRWNPSMNLGEDSKEATFDVHASLETYAKGTESCECKAVNHQTPKWSEKTSVVVFSRSLD